MKQLQIRLVCKAPTHLFSYRDRSKDDDVEYHLRGQIFARHAANRVVEECEVVSCCFPPRPQEGNSNAISIYVVFVCMMAIRLPSIVVCFSSDIIRVCLEPKVRSIVVKIGFLSVVFMFC